MYLLVLFLCRYLSNYRCGVSDWSITRWADFVTCSLVCAWFEALPVSEWTLSSIFYRNSLTSLNMSPDGSSKGFSWSIDKTVFVEGGIDGFSHGLTHFHGLGTNVPHTGLNHKYLSLCIEATCCVLALSRFKNGGLNNRTNRNLFSQLLWMD